MVSTGNDEDNTLIRDSIKAVNRKSNFSGGSKPYGVNSDRGFERMSPISESNIYVVNCYF